MDSSRPAAVPDSRNSVYIRLAELPRTALASDIRRAVENAGIAGTPFTVHLDYFRFLPSSSAFLQFNTNAEQRAALKHIGGKRCQIAGQDVYAMPGFPSIDRVPKRTRGFKGRALAAAKGNLDGTGLDAGILERGRNVVLWGLPGKLEPDNVKAVLRGYKLKAREKENNSGEQSDTDDGSVVKLAHWGNTLTSRHLVRLESTSEAHRLVRRIHMTYWDRGIWGVKYLTRARVVY